VKSSEGKYLHIYVFVAFIYATCVCFVLQRK